MRVERKLCRTASLQIGVWIPCFRGKTLTVNNLLNQHQLSCVDAPVELISRFTLSYRLLLDKLNWLPHTLLFLSKEEAGQHFICSLCKNQEYFRRADIKIWGILFPRERRSSGGSAEGVCLDISAPRLTQMSPYQNYDWNISKLNLYHSKILKHQEKLNNRWQKMRFFYLSLKQEETETFTTLIKGSTQIKVMNAS